MEVEHESAASQNDPEMTYRITDPSALKVFTKILTRRLTKTLDENQPVEQAGFRGGYGTMDHLQTVNQLIEKVQEFNVNATSAKELQSMLVELDRVSAEAGLTMNSNKTK